MNRQTTDPSSAGDAAESSVFIPPMDPATGTWLSLGSYEEVFNSDLDYWAIHKALKQDNMTLDKVLRIHNDFLKDRLTEELSLVKRGRSSDFDPNIQDLYHGTSESLERICNEGLDERLSTSGHFGRGIYFSDRPGVCRIQSEISSPAKPFIVRCRVILGDCKVYPEGDCDPYLTREPVKPTTTVGKNVFYDSVRGKTGDFNQFVIYEKRRAMVQYVIFYTTTDPLPSLPPIPRSELNPSKKKKPKKKKRTSVRHSIGSSRSNTPHSAAPSVGEGTQSESDPDSRSSGSVRSVVSSPSSDDNYSSDENSSHLGAVGGRLTPRNRSTGERSRDRDHSPQEQPEQASVPKAKSTRDRTRRLLSGANTNAESPAAASSSSAGTLIGQDQSYVVDANKKKMQEAAMKHMLDLKGHVPPDKISELWEDFNRTYGGGGTSGDIEENIPSSAFSATEDVDVEAVIDVLVEEFRQIVPGINPRAARQYIIQFDMDINKAMSAYFDSS